MLSIAGVAAGARSAHACGASPCWPDTFVPYHGTLPANATGIVWRPGHRYAVDGGARGPSTTSPDELSLECTNEDDITREVPFHATGEGRVRALVFDGPLFAGDECEITPHFEPCGVEESDARYSGAARFTVTPAAPMPTSLGTLEAKGGASHGRVPLPTSDGSCYHEHLACTARVGLRLSEEAQPWADALDFETLVDDVPWAYPLFPGVYGALPEPERGTDIVFVANAETQGAGLDSGTHILVMQATLAGIDEPIHADELELDLTCKAAAPEREDQPLSVAGSNCGTAGPRSASSASFGLAGLLFALAALVKRSGRLRRSR